MARTKHSKQLSQAEIERFLAEAERLHKSIVQPLLYLPATITGLSNAPMKRC
ncbi:hypothetical protein NKI63_26980 [Mesorhizobium sp. M0410]|uniref:hypothetical protein n=1 Tax=Mesorhizobium sp. M0410 TaxID=2956943 RepID=UPI0033394041